MIGAVTIGRDSNNRVVIRMFDTEASVQFAQLELSCEAFALAITGQAHTAGELQVRSLDRVGKKQTVKSVSAKAPKKNSKAAYIAWIKANYEKDGWICDDSLNSQRSIQSYGHSGKYEILNFHLRRWD